MTAKDDRFIYVEGTPTKENGFIDHFQTAALDEYQVVGDGPYGVALLNGALEYDLIESRREAEIICDVLNQGKGPEWDKIEDEVITRLSR